MPHSILAGITLCIIALTVFPARARAQAPDSTMLRPTTVTVKISKDPDNDNNGTYHATGVSTKCGLADYGYPHRLHSFAVLFPDDTVKIDVTSVNFDADTLASGTTARSFYLSVGIRTARGGTPPHYVIRADEPQYNEPGTASRTTTANRSDSLMVKGTATKGRKVDVEMTLVCR